METTRRLQKEPLNEPVGDFDAADLKEKIRRLRQTKAQIEEDRKQMEDEMAKYENRLAGLRQELNIIGTIDHIQTGAADDFSEELNPEAMKKFRILSDKLDMKILNQEIRTVLPRLEKEANQWEQKSKGQYKISLRNEKNQLLFPSMMLMSTAEIEEQIGQVVEERYKVKSHASHDISVKKKEKVEVCADIAALRRRVSVLVGEKTPLLTARVKLRAALLLELGRIEAVRKEHRETRDMFGTGAAAAVGKVNRGTGIPPSAAAAGSEGWPAAAFLTLTGTAITLSVLRLLSLCVCLYVSCCFSVF
jgi:hypothetical protein